MSGSRGPCYTPLTAFSTVQEFNADNWEIVGPTLVAKESKHQGSQHLVKRFHKCFAKTQVTAMKIAQKFNEKIRERRSIVDPDNAQHAHVFGIEFLSCSVYTFMSDGVERCVLVEKMLPADRYVKWNGNNGYVHGRDRGSPRPAAGPVMDKEQQAGEGDTAGDKMGVGLIAERGRPWEDKMGKGKRPGTGIGVGMGPIAEGEEPDGDSDDAVSVDSMGDSDDEAIDYGVQQQMVDNSFPVGGDDSGDDVGGDGAGNKHQRASITPFKFDPRAEDFLQAFSHFSYWNSGRRMLVCDLQGVLARTFDDKARAGVFELTDPVIHYRSTSGRKQVYGKTDLGKKGVHKFFETHDCNDVCRLLGLPNCSTAQGQGGERVASKRRRTGTQPGASCFNPPLTPVPSPQQQNQKRQEQQQQREPKEEPMPLDDNQPFRNEPFPEQNVVKPGLQQQELCGNGSREQPLILIE